MDELIKMYNKGIYRDVCPAKVSYWEKKGFEVVVEEVEVEIPKPIKRRKPKVIK